MPLGVALRALASFGGRSAGRAAAIGSLGGGSSSRPELELTFDSREWDRLEARLSGKASDWRPAARRIHRVMQVRTDSVFAANRLGGTHRGLRWNYFAPQYTRKDGTVVPAWGGVARADGTGQVQGRLRPSGQRIRRGDSVVQDTGNLRRNALLSLRLTKTRLEMGTNVEYADDQAKRRPWATFHLPDDLNMMRQEVIRYFEVG